MYPETLDHCQEIVDETLLTLADKLDNADLLGKVIRLAFNKRFKRTLGRMSWRTNCPDVIEFSAQMWPIMSDAERRHTVVHETCHAVALAHYGYPKGVGHNTPWRHCMRLMGYSGGSEDVRPKIENSVQVLHPAYCGCETNFLGPQQYKKVLSGKASYRCRDCGQRVRLDK